MIPSLAQQAALLASATFLLGIAEAAPRTQTPNVVFLVGDDLGCQLGAYGNRLVRTPHLDRLAAEGAVWTRMFATSSVCAPARSTLFTGTHPVHLGTMHMRSRLARPPKVLTEYLRGAGYTVAWPNKIDFNFEPNPAFRDTKEHWSNGPLPKEPFFAYLNLGESHESVLMEEKLQKDFYRELDPSDRTNPADVQIPPYLPDDPEVRASIALYYDMISAMDKRVGRILDLLEKEGKADRTIVVFVGDGGWPFPRGKRWLYDSGLRVPFIVRWPGVIPAGTTDESLASFIDIMPTLLHATSVPAPASMPGRILFGPARQAPPRYIFAARDRMDEVEDRSRALRDERFKYIRNFRTEVPYNVVQKYAESTPAVRVLRRLLAQNTLPPGGAWFALDRKPEEELYDTQNDPHETQNLAFDPTHAATLARLSAALEAWLAEGDMGAAPEQKLIDDGVLLPAEKNKP